MSSNCPAAGQLVDIKTHYAGEDTFHFGIY